MRVHSKEIVMTRHPILTGILVARVIMTGDVGTARLVAKIAGPNPSWTPAECRAVIGACREMNRRHGCSIDWRAILWGAQAEKKAA
jgi:hypothetical protein